MHVTGGGIDPRRAGNTIELKLREVMQLFNSLDPSPLLEKDLDRDAEEFIMSWAQELPPRRAVDPAVFAVGKGSAPAGGWEASSARSSCSAAPAAA